MVLQHYERHQSSQWEFYKKKNQQAKYSKPGAKLQTNFYESFVKYKAELL